MTDFGDRLYPEAELIAQYVGHPRAPWQATVGGALRAAYFHGHQHGCVLIQQGAGFNTRDFVGDAAVQRTVLAPAAGFAGIARGYARLKRGQTRLVATVAYAPRTVNSVIVTHQLSAFDPDAVATDIVEEQREHNADHAGIGRFQGPNGTIHGFNSRAAAVAGSVEDPFTSGFKVIVDRIELPLVDVSSDGGVRVRILCAIRANQQASTGAYNVPIHVQPVFVLVTAEHHR